MILPARVCLGFLTATSLLLCASREVTGSPDGRSWKELKSQHVIVMYEKDTAFAGRVARAAERYYKETIQDLGFRRTGNFWLWDNRARIIIYRDRADYVASTKSPAWSGGRASFARREIATHAGTSGFVESRLPHEMAHLIFRDYIGFEGDVPLWLDEGVAQWQEKQSRAAKLAEARAYLKQGNFMSIYRLANVTVGDLTSAQTARAFYAQSVSLVGCLIQKGGQRNFAVFCRQLRDGKSVEDALRFTYPRSMRSIGALQKAWMLWLRKEE